MKRNKNLIAPLVSLGLIALILRVTYFVLALSNQKIETLFYSIPDSRTYWSVAQHFFDSHPMGEYWLFQVGPGYGLLLAGIYKLFGDSIYALYIFNIIIGSLAPIIIYCLADELLGNKKVAYIAGLISAISLTSISLSCNILTDQPFFTLFSLTLLLFVKGINNEKIKYFVWAGIIASLAIYIRAIGMFWFLIFPVIPFLIPLPSKYKSKIQLLKKVCITSGIMFLMVFCWSAKNYVEHDVFTFGGNGIRAARIRLATMAVANNTKGITYKEVDKKWIDEDSVYFEGIKPSIGQDYTRTKEHFISIVKKHPNWVVNEYFTNVKDNLLGTNTFPRTQIPQYNDFWLKLMSINEEWLAVTIVVISLLSLILLVLYKKYTAFVLLGITYCYFAFINGFTMWQGSRLQYPVEIAWSILVAFFLYELYQIVVNLTKKVLSLK